MLIGSTLFMYTVGPIIVKMFLISSFVFYLIYARPFRSHVNNYVMIGMEGLHFMVLLISLGF